MFFLTLEPESEKGKRNNKKKEQQKQGNRRKQFEVLAKEQYGVVVKVHSVQHCKKIVYRYDDQRRQKDEVAFRCPVRRFACQLFIVKRFSIFVRKSF